MSSSEQVETGEYMEKEGGKVLLRARSVLVVHRPLGSVTSETRASWIWSYSTYSCRYCEAGPGKPPGDLGNAAPTSDDSDRWETFQGNLFVGGRPDFKAVSHTSLCQPQVWGLLNRPENKQVHT